MFGLSVADGSGTAKTIALTVDSDKLAFVDFKGSRPMLVSNAGAINQSYNGIGEDIDVYVSKNTNLINAYTGPDYTLGGNLNIPFHVSTIDFNSSSLSTAKISSCNSLNVGGSANLSSIEVHGAKTIDANGCALTADSIEKQLLILVKEKKQNGTLNISGGSNAYLNFWSFEARNYHAELLLRGWTITINE